MSTTRKSKANFTPPATPDKRSKKDKPKEGGGSQTKITDAMMAATSETMECTQNDSAYSCQDSDMERCFRKLSTEMTGVIDIFVEKTRLFIPGE